MLHWFQDRKRKKIIETSFPESWRTILIENVAHYRYLDKDETHLLENLIQIFIAEKNFEACGDLALNDEIKVVIAAQACLLVIGLPSYQYSKLMSILVYPSTVTIPAQHLTLQTNSLEIVPDQQAILGLACQHGTVVLVWDSVLNGARHPDNGHNVVYHEFAHILDMRDGRADGTPEIHVRALFKSWVKVFTEEFLRLREQARLGKPSLLDKYGAVNEAEFFAVATELFFDKPLQMKKEYEQLYIVLANYYQQDTAQRELRYIASKKR